MRWLEGVVDDDSANNKQAEVDQKSNNSSSKDIKYNSNGRL